MLSRVEFAHVSNIPCFEQEKNTCSSERNFKRIIRGAHVPSYHPLLSPQRDTKINNQMQNMQF